MIIMIIRRRLRVIRRTSMTRKQIINSALKTLNTELKGIKIVGIDLHIGSQITDILPFEIAIAEANGFIGSRVSMFPLNQICSISL